MKNQAHIGERVANFGAFVKAEAAYDTIANAQAAQDFFEGARLRAGAIQHRNPCIRLVAHQSRQLAANKLSLCRRIRRLKKFQASARSECGLESFSEPVG